MRYQGRLYRPPSEAHSYILQATLGCSWNKCTYCDMYRDKEFAVRPWEEIEQDLEMAREELGPSVTKVFVADGDALVMSADLWLRLLERCHAVFPALRQVSCYAMATNITGKTAVELEQLRAAGLSLLYIGPETGDAEVMRRIAKGSSPQQHIDAAHAAHAAGMRLSAIFLLGAGGLERSEEHAMASATLATAMDPEFLAALTLTVVPGTPIATLEQRGRFSVPPADQLLRELREFVARATPSDALFRTNHASNYLPLGGRLPRDRAKIVGAIDAALAGEVPLRPDWLRGL